MATERFAAVGNYIKLTKDSAAGTVPGEFAIITGRFVSDEKAADNRTTLAIYSSQSTFDKMKAGIRKQDNSACNFAEYIERNARTVLKDCNNTRLSNVVGAGDIWKDFISQTTRRLNAADFGKDFRGSPAHPHAGKTFNGLVPVVDDDGVVQMVQAKWTVSAGPNNKTYLVKARVGGEVKESKLTAKVLDSMFEKAKSTVVSFSNTDAEVDLADYSHVAEFLQECNACTVHDTVSARAVIRIMKAAGFQVSSTVADSKASEWLLNRFAKRQLDAWDSWFSEAAEAAADGKLPAKFSGAKDEASAGKLIKILAAWSAAQLDDAMADAMAAPADDSGAGLRLTRPSPAASDASAVPAGLSPVAMSVPRYNALRSIAADEAAMSGFDKAALAFVESDESKRNAIASHEASRVSEIEAWLVTGGALLDPVLVKGYSCEGGKDAGQLLALCLSALRKATKESAASAAATPSHVPERPVRCTVRYEKDSGESGTELEKRERDKLAADVSTLESEESSMKKLKEMKELADSGADADLKTLQTLVEREPDGALLRIIYSSTEVSHATADADPKTIEAISNIRTVLDTALERAVLGSKAREPSDRLIRALRYARLRRLGRVRLLHLLDKDDSGSKANPLAAFKLLSAREAVSSFSLALSRLQTALMFSFPTHTAESVQFISELQRKCLEAAAVGVSWDDIEIYFSQVLLRADKGLARGTWKTSALGVGALPEPLDSAWATDAAHEWVSEFNQLVTAAKNHSEQKQTFQNKLDEMEKRMLKAIGSKRPATSIDVDDDDDEPDPRKSPKKPRKPKKPKKPPTGGGGVGQVAPTSAKSAADKKAEKAAQFAADLEARKAKRLELQAAMTKDMGLKDGKPPCYFFHRPNGTCKFAAKDCQLGYH